MKPLLILGAHGQVGRALATRALVRGIKNAALSRLDCDITDRLAVERVVSGVCIAVNCAAYTAVDDAETNEEAAFRINRDGAANVAQACARSGIPLVHISTDYVFDGESSQPIKEEDPPHPLNVYGRSKLAGEEKVRTILAQHIILRSSWIFSLHGRNFVKTILRLAKSQPQLRVVADQIGGPTAAKDIADAILDIMGACERPGFADWGTYHFTGAPPISWYEFAQAIVGEGSPVVVVPVASKDFPLPARRPQNSVLDCGRILRVFGIQQPDWREALAKATSMSTKSSTLR
jgi:dTDP-4-dehydrorhamnose reductase